MSFQGSIVALATPFKKGKVDEKTLRKLVRFQIDAGTDGIVPVGTTGECPTLSFKEHERVIEIVVETANHEVPVIAGTGSNSTEEAIYLTKFAKKVGAEGALLVTPYYNKPTQEGLYRHYEMISKKVDIPIVLYNVPGRTGVSLSPQTVARLSKVQNIVGIKEATGSMDQSSEILSLCNMTVLSGDDSLTLPLLSIGAKGVISVVANILPQALAELVDAYFANNIHKARQHHLKLFPICRAVFIETNPVPVKTAMGLMGLCDDEVRLPLCPMQPANIKILVEAMRNYGIDLKERVKA